MPNSPRSVTFLNVLKIIWASLKASLMTMGLMFFYLVVILPIIRPVPSAPAPATSSSGNATVYILPGRPPSSSDPTAQKLGDGPFASCFQGWVCSCQDEGKFCLDPSIGHYVICSRGLVLTFEEYDAFGYGELLYSNACRPKGWPALSPCVIGKACNIQSLANREMCIADGSLLALCNNGRVVDFSNPEARLLVKDESCEEPPPPCDPQQHGSDPISL